VLAQENTANCRQDKNNSLLQQLKDFECELLHMPELEEEIEAPRTAVQTHSLLHK